MKWILSGLAAMGIMIVAWLAYTLHWAGAFRSATPHFGGDCTSITGPGLIGVEDIVIDHQRSVAYLSAYDRRSETFQRGGIFLLPLYPADAEPVLTDLTLGAPEDLSPHGIDLHIDEDGVRRLFVVNHRGGSDGPEDQEVLIYRLGETGYLDLEERIAAPAIFHPNDVAAIGPRSAFVTNDRLVRDPSRDLLDTLFRSKTGNVVLIHDGEAKAAAGPFAYANGVTFDQRHGVLYVSTTTDRDIRAFRVTENGALLPLSRAKTRGHGDNFAFDERGDLIIATHLNLLAFMQHADDGAVRSPAEVEHFTLSGEAPELAATGDILLTASGAPEFGATTPLSGLSVAAKHHDILLLGSVFEDGIWRCELKPTPISPAGAPPVSG